MRREALLGAHLDLWPSERLANLADKNAKAANMTGWVQMFEQKGGVAALNGPQDHLPRWLAEYDRRRRLVVDGLNALGIGPRDLITILQAIKAAGAIQADIEVM